MIYIRDLDRVDINGWFGNNLFQVAAGLALAIRNNTDLVIPKTWQYAKYFPEQGVLKYGDKSDFKIQSEYTEPHFHYAPIPYQDGMNLNGYYQSWKYFHEIKDELRNVYFSQISKEFPGEAQKYIPKSFLETENKIIAIHVRRGDYRKFAAHHPLQTMEYYNKGIEYFLKKFPNCKFFVFSNDIAECKQMFVGDKFFFCDSPQATTEGNDSTIMDFTLMTSCDGFIIANSSFSWWTSYLNDYPTKHVVAPKTWFGPAKVGHETHDLYCPDWVKL